MMNVAVPFSLMLDLKKLNFVNFIGFELEVEEEVHRVHPMRSIHLIKRPTD